MMVSGRSVLAAALVLAAPSVSSAQEQERFRAPDVESGERVEFTLDGSVFAADSTLAERMTVHDRDGTEYLINTSDLEIRKRDSPLLYVFAGLAGGMIAAATRPEDELRTGSRAGEMAAMGGIGLALGGIIALAVKPGHWEKVE